MNRGVTGRAGNARNFRQIPGGPKPQFTGDKWEPLPERVEATGPARVRQGMDRVITHELVARATREFQRRGGKILRMQANQRNEG